jgi:uncharacterized protein YecE (DUF72 family)
MTLARAGPGCVRIGISGWRYEPWRGVFYPDGLRHDDELAFASRRFSSIEINGSFYSLQRPEYYQRWYDETPQGFVFAVKGPRFVTHMLKLRGVEPAMANFYASGVANLHEKLGPFLWQLPPQLGYDRERLEAFFALLPRDTDQAAALARRQAVRLLDRRPRRDARRDRPRRGAADRAGRTRPVPLLGRHRHARRPAWARRAAPGQPRRRGPCAG